MEVPFYLLRGKAVLSASVARHTQLYKPTLYTNEDDFMQHPLTRLQGL